MKKGAFFIMIIISLFFISYFYLSIISPVFAIKPEINENNTKDINIVSFLNEIGAYKLHENPITEEQPVIEVILENRAVKYLIINSTYIPSEKKPDIIIYINENDILYLLEEDEFNERIKKQHKENKIKIEAITKRSDLALKGYKPVFDLFIFNEITGNAMLPISNGFNMLFLILAFALINTVKEKI